MDADPDFERARSLIGDHTGVMDVYDPLAEEMVQSAVDELLPGAFTVDRAVRVAFLNNREFQSLFFELGASRADVVQSTLLSNPSVAFLVKFPEGGGRSLFEFGMGQELVDLWQIPVRKRLAEAHLEQVLLTIARRAVELRAQVKSRFHEVQAARLSEAAARENVELVRESLSISQQRLQAGEISRIEFSLERAVLLDAQVELIEAQRDRRVAEVELARVLGLSRQAWSLDIEDRLPPVQAVPDDAELLQLAMTQRLDARAAAQEVLAARHELKLQYRSIFPSIVLGFELERPERRALPGRKVLADTARESIAAGGLAAPGIESRAQRELERRQIVDALLGPSLELTLPIWDQNQAQIARARFEVQRLRKAFEDLLDEIVNEVQTAAATARGGQELVEFYEREALPEAERNVENARALHHEGEEDVLQLIAAQRSLIERRTGYINAMRGHLVAMAELEAVAGGLLAELPAAEAVEQP